MFREEILVFPKHQQFSTPVYLQLSLCLKSYRHLRLSAVLTFFMYILYAFRSQYLSRVASTVWLPLGSFLWKVVACIYRHVTICLFLSVCLVF